MTTQEQGALLEAMSLVKSYPPGVTALDDVSLVMARGEIVCLLGPSGCGKTTLLRIVAGLEQADRGAVFFAGRDLAAVPVHQRNFGLMFQDFALFPDKSVAQNIAFGLRMAGLPHAKIAERVDEMLALVNLHGYGRRTIFQLSGGERQRVALARSLAPRPHLLMLDEPLGSLDRTLREELMMELRTILKRLDMTALYVTHDQNEALAVADRVAVMNQGRIIQEGTPRAVYQRPATPFVASFLGFINHLPAVVEAGSPHQARTDIGSFRLPQPVAPGTYVLVIRPDALKRPRHSDDEVVLNGIVENASFRGNFTRVEIMAEGKWRLVFETPSDWDWVEDQSIRFSINPDDCVLLPGP
jgi:ABC-type Fe3+/spermidine/putrescine transport system ATPase subunit